MKTSNTPIPELTAPDAAVLETAVAESADTVPEPVAEVSDDSTPNIEDI